jgi:hypothetical protein
MTEEEKTRRDEIHALAMILIARGAPSNTAHALTGTLMKTYCIEVIKIAYQEISLHSSGYSSLRSFFSLFSAKCKEVSTRGTKDFSDPINQIFGGKK